MDLLYLYNNVHTSSFHIISSLLHIKKHTNCSNATNNINTSMMSKESKNKSTVITMATITPAQTTTQLLISNTQPCASTFTLPQQIIGLSMLLQNNSKIPVMSSTGVGPLKPLYENNKEEKEEKRDPPPAQQPKRPAWTESHAYVRGPRTNGDNLRIVATEVNMIRASKITRSLKPRRPYLSRREDEFVWAKPSSLRMDHSRALITS